MHERSREAAIIIAQVQALGCTSPANINGQVVCRIDNRLCTSVSGQPCPRNFNAGARHIFNSNK